MKGTITFSGFVYHLEIDYSGGHDAGVYEEASSRVSEKLNNSPGPLQDRYHIVEDEYTVTATLTDTTDTNCPQCGDSYTSTVETQADIRDPDTPYCIGDLRVYLHN